MNDRRTQANIAPVLKFNKAFLSLPKESGVAVTEGHDAAEIPDVLQNWFECMTTEDDGTRNTDGQM